MLLLGTTFFAGSLTVPATPTSVEEIKEINLQNGIYDDLFMSSETNSLPIDEIQKDWDFNTLFYAEYDNTTTGGNMSYTLATVSRLLIKKRIKGDYAWQTIAYHDVSSIDDFNFSGIDRLCASDTEYQFAVVPVLDSVEGSYTIINVLSKFDQIWLIGSDFMYGSAYGDAFCDTVRNVESSIITTLNDEKPTYCSNSKTNYDTGTLEAEFFYTDEESCQFSEPLSYAMRSGLMNILASRKTLLLKHFDGRTWLIKVTGNPTDTAQEYYSNRMISFEWVEIGNWKSQKDLYYASLFELGSEWW